MNEPNWLAREVLLAIQGELLNRFGGLAGIRDEGLMDSAINKPKNLFAYGQPTPFELAASYATGLVKNHPFLDGNKRIGFMAAYVFLGANGWSLEGTEEEAVLETLALAAGESTESDYSAWLALNSVEM